MTQRELAQAIGTTQQHISEWESNKTEPTLTNLLKLSRLLHYSLDDLMEELNDYANEERR